MGIRLPNARHCRTGRLDAEVNGIGAVDWKGRTAVVRSDLNVPLDKDGNITDDTRIRQSLPTIKHILEGGGGCAVLSHLGRPKEGDPDPKLSLFPVYQHLRFSASCGKVGFAATLDEAGPPGGGELLLIENTRFNSGEKACDHALSKRYARLGDIFVMDAFASAHRGEASIVGVAGQMPSRRCGLLMQAELEALDRLFGEGNVRRPFMAVIGGAKVSTKFDVLRNLLAKVDRMILGGGIANTFLAASKMRIGTSLSEPEMYGKALSLLEEFGDKILLQNDCICAPSAERADEYTSRAIEDVSDKEMILDIGPASIVFFTAQIGKAATILWNGPVGLFEKPQFARGTEAVGRAIIASAAYSVAGGGDTVSAINKFRLGREISHVCTGGGAMLEYLEGRELPGIRALR